MSVLGRVSSVEDRPLTLLDCDDSVSKADVSQCDKIISEEDSVYSAFSRLLLLVPP